MGANVRADHGSGLSSSLLLCPPPQLSWLPEEVPSVQDVNANPSATWMSPGPQQAPTSGAKLSGSPRPSAPEMGVEGRDEWLRGEMEDGGSDVDTQEGEEPGEYIMCLCFLSFLGSRDQRWAHEGQPSAWDNPRGDHGPHLPASGPGPSLQQSPDGQPLRPDSRPRDCRYSPYGCCPDGHTAALGPQWQGCPGASCRQSR